MEMVEHADLYQRLMTSNFEPVQMDRECGKQIILYWSSALEAEDMIYMSVPSMNEVYLIYS